MFWHRAWRCAVLAILIAAPAAAAPRARVNDFDVSRATTWADALALCDLTSFLRTRPNLDADVILAPDSWSEQLRVLHGPRFIPPGLFFDKRMRLAFERLARAGEIDQRSFGRARARHDRALFRSYERADAAELAFVEEQSRLCAALGQDIRTRYP